ncbi:MAG: primosomal protein N' [Proteobacteria bacterium]|nr:primosomal protein N' [Pseudomonadota bacterium]
MQKNEPLIAEAALTVPVKRNLHYQIPSPLRKNIEVGSRLLVPLGKRRVTAYVVALKSSSDIKNIKPIEEVLDPFPSFSLSDLNFFKWAASYYCCSLGEVIKNALPPGINAKTDRSVAITSNGQKSLTDKNLSPRERMVLLTLAKKRAVRFQSLAVIFKPKKISSLTSSLLRKEYITITQRQSSQTVNPLKEKVFQVNEKELSNLSLSEWKRMIKKAPRQFSMLKWLLHEGKTTQKQITSRWGRGGYSLNALEKKGLIIVFFREIYRDPLIDKNFALPSPPQLTREQAEVLKKIVPKIKKGEYTPFLLHGVTGSGKTEVYLEAVEATLKTGRGAIVLVPEISLTPQFIASFQKRFNNRIAQIHSGLSKGERFDEWRRIRTGGVQIVIGARSAIFAPLPSLGIIIVDEEHDSAYKQDKKICYNARDLALVKGKMNNAVVILGSATPMMETYYNALIGKFNHLHLSQRVNNRSLPRVEVLDMRNEKANTILSLRLKNAIREKWERREQTLLFLNRRGFAPFVLCRKCGYTFRCPNCNVSLVYHQNKGGLLCHYCNYSTPAPDICPVCKRHKVEIIGFGTEKLESEIKKLFPDLKVGRLDRDTVSKKNSLQKILGQFRRGETELLIGTQMMAIGHDLPRVTLVGIIAADISLNFPDFRAGERTFQMLTQVAGRSGRGEIPGEVLIQTYNPNHPSIKMAITQNFLSFYKQEISHRKELTYPPFSRLTNFLITGNNQFQTRQYAATLGRLSAELQQNEAVFKNTIEILGPAPAPWEKLKGKYRWQMLIKGCDHKVLHLFTEKIMDDIKPQINISGVTLRLDVDPLNLL